MTQTPADTGAAPDARRNVFRNGVLFAVALVAATVLTAIALVRFADVILLVFAGLLNAAFLTALTDATRRVTRLPRPLALVLVCLALLVLSAAAVILAAPEVGNQVDALAAALPHALAAVLEWLGRYEWGNWLIGALPTAGAPALSHAPGIFSTTLGVLGSIVVVVIVGLFLAAEPSTYKNGVVSLFPPRHRARAQAVLDEMGDVIRQWLRAVGIEMLVMGVLVWIGLTVLRIPVALTLALLAALSCAIPNLGPVLSTVPAVLFAFLEGANAALYVLIFMVAVHVFQSYVVAPLVERRTISLPPALTLLVQLVLGAWVGVVGVLVATPLTAVLVLLVRRLYVDRMPPAE